MGERIAKSIRLAILRNYFFPYRVNLWKSKN
jgi:hypothetical protein